MPAHQQSSTQMLQVDVRPNKGKGTIPLKVEYARQGSTRQHSVSTYRQWVYMIQSMSLVSIQNTRNKLTRGNPSRAVWDKFIYMCCEVQLNAKALDREKEHSPTTTHPPLPCIRVLPINNHLAIFSVSLCLNPLVRKAWVIA